MDVTPYQEHKEISMIISDKISRFDEERSAIMRQCGTSLSFSVYRDQNSGNEFTKLFHSNFCKDRLCPMCQWRRSLKFNRQIQECVRHIGLDHNYYMVSFTIVNVPGWQLGHTLSRMMLQFGKMMNDRRYRSSFLGWVRSFEVTYNSERLDFHPHFHMLLELSDDFVAKYTENGLKEFFFKLWESYWMRKVNIKRKDGSVIEDLHPKALSILGFDLHKVYQKVNRHTGKLQTYEQACCEVSKYCAMLDKNDWSIIPANDFEFLSDAIKNHTLITFSGSFRKARRALALPDPDSILDKDDQCESNLDLVHIRDEHWYWYFLGGTYQCSRRIWFVDPPKIHLSPGLKEYLSCSQSSPPIQIYLDFNSGGSENAD